MNCKKKAFGICRKWNGCEYWGESFEVWAYSFDDCVARLDELTPDNSRPFAPGELVVIRHKDANTFRVVRAEPRGVAFEAVA